MPCPVFSSLIGTSVFRLCSALRERHRPPSPIWASAPSHAAARDAGTDLPPRGYPEPVRIGGTTFAVLASGDIEKCQETATGRGTGGICGDAAGLKRCAFFATPRPPTKPPRRR